MHTTNQTPHQPTQDHTARRAQTTFETLHAGTYLAAATTGTTAGYALNTATTHAPTIRLLAAIIVGFTVAYLTRRILNHLLANRLDHLWNTARPTPLHGDRIQLTTDIEAAGTRHQAGQQGTVHSSDHTRGQLTVRMDDGRTNFPHGSEVTVLPNAGTEATR